MKLTWEGLQDRAGWEDKGIRLPGYDWKKAAQLAREQPVWVHVGIGNIFRMFIGGIADQMLEQGVLDRGITCVETYDEEVVDRVYRPHDNLSLNVTLYGDGTKERRVIGSLAEACMASTADSAAWARLKEIFTAPSLQMVSYTITEKGYSLTGADGTWLPAVAQDLASGPEAPATAMGITAAMLYERYLSGGEPVALVSMDNCSRNGEKLRGAVLTIAEEWEARGLVPAAFPAYLRDEGRVAFPWTMIDKITPRPSPAVAEELAADGVEDMGILVTAKKTYIAPFVNAEGPQYLVVEDHFPNGRPPLEKAGVYMTDRNTVNMAEKMKVTVCLNPLHTALCTYGCLLGYEFFSDCMKDWDLLCLAEKVGLDEGMKVVPDPGILSPEAFLQEVVRVRFPNPYLGDTTQRIAVDISQMVGIRFGETIRAYMERYGTAKELVGIPLAIAGWLRYLLALDDEGKPMELAPDPMIPELQERLGEIRFGNPDSVGGRLRGILSNENIFHVDLYEAGVGGTIEQMFREEIVGPAAVRRTLRRWLAG